MQVYILMQSAGPFGQAAQNADERRRAVCRAAFCRCWGGTAAEASLPPWGQTLPGRGKSVKGRAKKRYGQALGSPFGGAAERMRS